MWYIFRQWDVSWNCMRWNNACVDKLESCSVHSEQERASLLWSCTSVRLNNLLKLDNSTGFDYEGCHKSKFLTPLCMYFTTRSRDTFAGSLSWVSRWIIRFCFVNKACISCHLCDTSHSGELCILYLHITHTPSWRDQLPVFFSHGVYSCWNFSEFVLVTIMVLRWQHRACLLAPVSCV
jgi:hypothetical protein